MRVLAAILVLTLASACSDSDAGPAGRDGEDGADGQNGTDGRDGETGAPGLSVSSAVDRLTGAAGVSIDSVPESSLTALPAGAGQRRVMVLSAVLRGDADESSPVIGVFQGFIEPTPVEGAYPVVIWDPATGAEFLGSGADVVHLYVTSFFSL